MLSKAERKEIDHHLHMYPSRQNACIDALLVIKKHRRWVSDEAVEDIADYLDMTIDEVDHVATFYNQIYRQPVGEHVILICDSVSCWVVGYEKILEHLKKQLGIGLGQTTTDNKFTLLPVQCLGACDRAPAMMIDESTFYNLTTDRVDEILAQYN